MSLYRRSIWTRRLVITLTLPLLFPLVLLAAAFEGAACAAAEEFAASLRTISRYWGEMP